MCKMTSIAIVTPSYDDLACIVQLAKEIHDLSKVNTKIHIDLVVINDSPWIEIAESLHRLPTKERPAFIQVLQLKANLGHQAAIAIGLAWLLPRLDHYDYIVTMDVDGEDNPGDIPAMVHEIESSCDQLLACAAKRGLRREKYGFKIGYKLYKLMTYLLLGNSIDFGNYICFRPAAVKILTRLPEATTHIAASTLRSRIPMGKILSDRRRRYCGESRMGDYTSLILHAFRAYSVFGDKITVRLIIYVLVGLAVSIAGAMMASFIRFSGVWNVFPGWASIISLILLGLGAVVAVNLFGLAMLLIATSRSSLRTTPLTLLEQFLEEEIVV